MYEQLADLIAGRKRETLKMRSSDATSSVVNSSKYGASDFIFLLSCKRVVTVESHVKYTPTREMVLQSWSADCTAMSECIVLCDGLQLILAVGEQDDQVQGCTESMLECIRWA